MTEGKTVRLAAIDIGSNAVRMLIADAGPGPRFRRVDFVRVPLRLGEEVFASGRIGPEKERLMCLAMGDFARRMESFGVEEYLAYATSAVREASDCAHVVHAVGASSGIVIEVIDGAQEASVVFLSAEAAFPEGMPQSCLGMDVGGGSTELTLFRKGIQPLSHSFALGTVRMLAGGASAAELLDFENCLRRMCVAGRPEAIVGSGGNIRAICNLTGGEKEGCVETLRLRSLYQRIAPMTLAERMAAFRLKKSRADVIVPAMYLFLKAAEICGARKILVPRAGLAEGMIRRLYATLCR